MQSALIAVVVFLGIGLLLRATLPPLRALFIPASVVGGLIGFGVAQALLNSGPAEVAGLYRGDEAALANASDVQRTTLDIFNTLRGWPGPLLAVIFAALLLEKPSRPFRQAARAAAQQGVMVWLIVLGQSCVGLAAVLLVVWPMGFDVPASFGQMIEAGFSGGHGTAGAMGAIFEGPLNFPAGMDLGMLFATVGLVGGVVTGILWVNVGVRRGWTVASTVDLATTTGLEARRDPQPGAYARSRADVIEPMMLQLLLVGVAFAVGWAYQAGFIALLDTVAHGAMAEEHADNFMKFAGKLPLFLFTLLGGLTLRWGLSALKLDDLIDAPSLSRITGVAMEVLIVAAISTLRIEALMDYWQPTVLLLALGFAWSTFCLLVLAPRLLPRAYWFELGLINYGMSTGTTAQGMMLLRMVDPELKTPATEDYAVAAPLSAPFIGGGVITVSLPLLMAESGAGVPLVAVVAVMAAALVGLLVAGLFLAGRRPEASAQPPA